MKLKKFTAVLLSALMTVFASVIPAAAETGDMKISLGADLNSDQRAEVLSLLDLTEEDLENSEVIYVTNAEEHEYLDEYIDSSKIGTNALSSSKIVLEDAGAGITVTTYNIDYCTIGMYQSALTTAGVEDADVYVAGPTKISGTAALIGIMKAYDAASDGELNEDNVEAAVEELAVTSELGEVLGDTEGAEQLIAELKTELDEISKMSDDEVDAKISEVAESNNISLTDDEIAKIRKLLRTLQNLDLDGLLDKAKSLYESFTKLEGSANGLSGIFDNISKFLSGIFSKLSNWLSKIF